MVTPGPARKALQGREAWGKKVEFSEEEERRESVAPTGRIQQLCEAELLQQMSCEASVAPRTNRKAARRSLQPGSAPRSNHRRSIIYEHLTAAV